MSKYKVGDVIKLRDDLEVGEGYGAVQYLYSMEKLKNKALRIDSIDTEDDESAVYEIDGWWISDEMIEGLWEEYKEKQDKLKLIDVLNMIVKGELKEGTKVKVRENMYSFNDNDLKREDDEDFVITVFEENSFAVLDIEVELIEPPCEHEWSKYSVGRLGRTENYRRCKKCGIHEEDIEPIDNTKIEELIADEINGKSYAEAISIIGGKLNEVIRVINKE